MTNTDILLPTALTGCCMLTATELMGGFTREDGSREVLSQDDIKRCFIGRAKLLQATTIATLALYDQELSKGCTRRAVCGPVFLRLMNELRKNPTILCTLRWYTDRHGEGYADYHTGRHERDRHLCASCYGMLQDREKGGQRRVWRELPELMDVKVEGWDQGQVSPASAPAPQEPGN
ncbi:hypothetical protein BN946_scf184836.g36 [Trametes cinnabarina]|uniref:Uncharacterized protein n=1 Tax=Pycnoporus cinnabarinus TaxID=5643 RepID=A0A060S650_PYCCI|nr:hypothetical protein BN946_scf184836.g36 [Trametes cinnabarina]